MDVFIVGKSSDIPDSLQSMLADMSGIKVIGQTESEAGAVERIASLLPEVVILNPDSQSGSGTDLLEEIKKHDALIKVIVFAHYSGEDYFNLCKRAGADYFFDKSSQLMQLREILWKWAHTDRLDNQFRLGNRFDVFRQLP